MSGRWAKQLEAIDAGAGRLVERRVMDHHRRRLTRAGHAAVLAGAVGGWACSGWPTTRGNELTLLIDGAEALPRMAAAIERARSSVWLAGWFFSPDFRLDPDRTQSLRHLLAAVAERVDVRVLAWAGAPLPVFHPARKEVRSVRDELSRDTRVRVALDAHERPLHCHHEKLVIVDGELAFVGGIDLTSLGGNRFDTSAHEPRGSIGWHDATSLIRGPAVADVGAHFRMRWLEVTGEEVPAPAPAVAAGDVEVQIVRTVPEKIYTRRPLGEFTILESYLRALRAARHLIYLENQFLWSPEVVAVLADKLRHPPDDRFRLVLMLPAKPNNGNDDTRGQLGLLLDADGGAGRVLACTLYQMGCDSPQPIYVHAKIGIVDDNWLTIGSANLNEYSLFNDTEMNVVTRDSALARSTRLRLWSEHLDRPISDLDGDPTVIVDEIWRPVSETQLRRREAGQPLTHRLMRLPNVSRRREALRGPLDALLIDS